MIPPEAKESMDKNKMGLKGTVERRLWLPPGILIERACVHVSHIQPDSLSEVKTSFCEVSPVLRYFI